MKKYIIIFAIICSCAASAFSQYFFQGGVGADLFQLTDFDEAPASQGKNINLQIGRFVNERKMRSFSFSYNFGSKHVRLHSSTFYNGNYYYNYNEINTMSYIRLAYERKVTYANTEFDDPWNIYSIITYGLQFNTYKTEYTEPTINSIDATKEGGFGIDLGIGTGVARKFNTSTYAYCDIMYIEPIYYSYSLYAQITLQVGIRKLF